MGFESERRQHRIPVSDTQAYRQFGNAVVVPVVEFIAKSIEPYIRAAVAAGAPQREKGDIATIFNPTVQPMVVNG